MLYKMEQYISNSMIKVFEPAINQRVKYTANIGMVAISTANSNLDGAGTLGTIITGATNGTLVKSISIKSTDNVSMGMIRLFLYDGTNNQLIEEIPVSAVTLSSNGSTESFAIAYEVNYFLEPNLELRASTQNAESFIIIAEGLDISYP